MPWKKHRPPSAGEREFRLTGLREIGDPGVLDHEVLRDREAAKE